MVEAKKQHRSAYADRLIAALSDAKKSDNELAAHLGVSIQALRKLWRGESQALTAENNSKAAGFVGYRSDYLATGTGPRKYGQSATVETVSAATMSERARSIAERLDALTGARRDLAYALMEQTLSTIEAGEAPGQESSASAKRRSRKA